VRRTASTVSVAVAGYWPIRQMKKLACAYARHRPGRDRRSPEGVAVRRLAAARGYASRAAEPRARPSPNHPAGRS
jgi:hypothetical protein